MIGRLTPAVSGRSNLGSQEAVAYSLAKAPRLGMARPQYRLRPAPEGAYFPSAPVTNAFTNACATVELIRSPVPSLNRALS